MYSSDQSCIFSIITPVFSVTWSSEIILIYCSRNISDYHQGWKQLWNVPDKNPTRCMVTLVLEDCVSLFLHLCSSSHPDSLHTARHPKNKTLNIITPDSDTRCMESFYMKDKYCLHFLRCGQTQPSKRVLCNSLDSVVGSESVSSPSYLYNGENKTCKSSLIQSDF